MKTAQQLKDKYEKELENLQKTCNHKHTEWLEIAEIHGNPSGIKVKQCKICWKKLLRKTKCEACGKDFTYDERDWTTAQLCPECLKKGKYYCWEHKIIHNNRRGYCPKCKKIWKEVLGED